LDVIIRDEQMKVVELFCGAGGMSRGLSKAGFDVVGAYDNMQDAVDTYNTNLTCTATKWDLTNLLDIIPEIIALNPDMIAGGPPCQDYSNLGKRQEGKNANLTLAFAITIASVKPEWFLMENVIPAAKSTTWKKAKTLLKKAGYGISESKINCSYYGLPQARKRLFVVGRLGEQDGFLQSEIAKAATFYPMTVAQAFAPASPTKFPHPFFTRPKSKASDIIRRKGHIYTRPQHNGIAVRSISKPYPTITQTSAEPISNKFRAERVAHSKDSAPLDAAAPVDQEILSIIQGFPQNWQWCSKNKRRIMLMIANAVPPPVARIIGEVILQRSEGDTSPETEGNFLPWLVKDCRLSRKVARNIKANVGRARYILLGRTFFDAIQEIAALEASQGFSELPTTTKSDLRKALRLYRDFKVSKIKRGSMSSMLPHEANGSLRQRPPRIPKLNLTKSMKAAAAQMPPNEFDYDHDDYLRDLHILTKVDQPRLKVRV
jgi:DNA (cytosine-5)-methyltransferase 1